MFNKILIILAIIAAVFVYANMAKAEIVREGLVSYWTLDEADIEDKIAKDSVGPNDGTIYGDPKTAEGVVGEALQFDGVDDFIICGNDASLDMKEAFTLETWAYCEKLNSPLATKESSYKLTIDGQVKFNLSTPSHPWPGWGSGCMVSVDWHHVVVIYDGSKLKVYLDGEPCGAEDPAEGDVTVREKPFVIGSYGSNPADIAAHDMFRGRIDEVRLYNIALTQEEIIQNFESRAVGGFAVASLNKLAETWGKIKASK